MCYISLSGSDDLWALIGRMASSAGSLQGANCETGHEVGLFCLNGLKHILRGVPPLPTRDLSSRSKFLILRPT